MIGWTAVIFAIQGWLGETPAQAANATTPSYLQVGMAAMSLGVVSIDRTRKLRPRCRASIREIARVTPDKSRLLTLNPGLYASFLASYYEWRFGDRSCASRRCIEYSIQSVLSDHTSRRSDHTTEGISLFRFIYFKRLYICLRILKLYI